jgi:Fe-S-cluster containining protein
MAVVDPLARRAPAEAQGPAVPLVGRAGPRSGTQLHLLQGRPLFFPFASGSLGYACASCDAPCCKGQPLGIGRSRELVTIQQAQPRSTLFAAPGFRGGPLLSLQPPPDKCWFLDRKSRCRLEHVLGRESKPTGCRLFPFSTLLGVGESLAVVPDLLCPITLQPSSARSPLSSHDALTWELKDTQVPAQGHRALPDPLDLSWDEALPLERRLVDEAAALLLASAAPLAFYGPFADLQHQLTCALFGADSRPGTMATLEHDIRRFLAVNEAASPDGVRELVALTGTLRLSPLGTDDGPLPARRALPGLLVALSVVSGTFENMRGSRRTLRSLLGVWREQGPLLFALAHLGARPLPQTKTALDDALARLGPARPALYGVVEGIRGNGKKSVSLTVEELLRRERDAFAPPLTADAVANLHALGRVLRAACTFTPI